MEKLDEACNDPPKLRPTNVLTMTLENTSPSHKSSQTYTLWGPDGSRGTSQDTSKVDLIHRDELQATQTKRRKDIIPTELHSCLSVPQIEPVSPGHSGPPPNRHNFSESSFALQLYALTLIDMQTHSSKSEIILTTWPPSESFQTWSSDCVDREKNKKALKS